MKIVLSGFIMFPYGRNDMTFLSCLCSPKRVPAPSVPVQTAQDAAAAHPTLGRARSAGKKRPPSKLATVALPSPGESDSPFADDGPGPVTEHFFPPCPCVMFFVLAL